MNWRLALPLTLLAVLLLAQWVYAGGFEGPGAHAAVNSVEAALAAPDDTPCDLTGRIVEKLPWRRDRYLFEDKSGQIVVKIKRRVFGDFTVTPDLLVQITGKIDADGRYPNEVDVEYLGIIGPGQVFGY